MILDTLNERWNLNVYGHYTQMRQGRDNDTSPSAVLFPWSKDALLLNVCMESPPKKQKKPNKKSHAISDEKYLNQEQF